MSDIYREQDFSRLEVGFLSKDALAQLPSEHFKKPSTVPDHAIGVVLGVYGPNGAITPRLAAAVMGVSPEEAAAHPDYVAWLKSKEPRTWCVPLCLGPDTYNRLMTGDLKPVELLQFHLRMSEMPTANEEVA